MTALFMACWIKHAKMQLLHLEEEFIEIKNFLLSTYFIQMLILNFYIYLSYFIFIRFKLKIYLFL